MAAVIGIAGGRFASLQTSSNRGIGYTNNHGWWRSDLHLRGGQKI